MQPATSCWEAHLEPVWIAYGAIHCSHRRRRLFSVAVICSGQRGAGRRVAAAPLCVIATASVADVQIAPPVIFIGVRQRIEAQRIDDGRLANAWR